MPGLKVELPVCPGCGHVGKVPYLQAHLDGDGVEPARSDALELQRTLETFFIFAAESGALR